MNNSLFELEPVNPTDDYPRNSKDSSIIPLKMCMRGWEMIRELLVAEGHLQAAHDVARIESQELMELTATTCGEITITIEKYKELIPGIEKYFGHRLPYFKWSNGLFVI